MHEETREALAALPPAYDHLTRCTITAMAGRGWNYWHTDLSEDSGQPWHAWHFQAPDGTSFRACADTPGLACIVAAFRALGLTFMPESERKAERHD